MQMAAGHWRPAVPAAFLRLPGIAESGSRHACTQMGAGSTIVPRFNPQTGPVACSIQGAGLYSPLLPKKIAILGSTGSIGTNAGLDVIARSGN